MGLVGSGEKMGSKPFQEFGRRKVVNQKSLLAGGGAGEQLDLVAFQAQGVGQNVDDSFVGPASIRGGRYGDSKRTGVLVENGVAPGAWAGADGQDRALIVRLDVDHGASPSNRAEPTRTQVAPSSMATSKSLDMPIESSGSAMPVRSRS